jgi:hypothetical protein
LREVQKLANIFISQQAKETFSQISVREVKNNTDLCISRKNSGHLAIAGVIKQEADPKGSVSRSFIDKMITE